MAQERSRRPEANKVTRLDHAEDHASVPPDEEAIQERAYARFRERGGEHGRDLEDWLEAERELSGGVRRR
jgi:hypothetical protein